MSNIISTQNIDPKTLLIDVNVRSDLALDKDFVGSIKENGVLVPIVAVQTDNGIRVKMGHRRTQAAVDNELATVPVVIIAPEALEGDEAEIERLLTQHAENHHRAALSDSDEVEMHRQLAAFGLSPTQIAKKTRTRKAHVEAALVVAGSSLKRELMEQQLTLEQAAVVTEFEDDPDACNALVEAAEDGRFDHIAQRLRDDREETLIIAVETARLIESGVIVIERPAYDSPVASLSHLIDATGAKITEETHTGCPGHAVYVMANRPWNDGKRGELQAVATAVCSDSKGNGHSDAYARSHGTDKKTAAQMTDTERETARAERRLVIENNKAWDAATEVRKTWLKKYLTRKTPPKSAALMLAQAFINRDEGIDKAFGYQGIGEDLLGFDHKTGFAEASDNRQQVIALGYLFAGYESGAGRHSWRSVNTGTARYLAFIADEGYGLSDVERLAVETRFPVLSVSRTAKSGK